MILSVVSVRTNAELLERVAPLWIGVDDQVLDLTYGRGKWWTRYRPHQFVSNDLHTPADLSFDYRRLPGWMADWCDVVCFDPPYISTGPSAKSTLAMLPSRHGTSDFRDRFGLDHTDRGWQNVFADVAAGIQQSARVVRPRGRVLVKCMDYVESGAVRWGRRNAVDAAEAAGLVQVDEFVHHSGTGPQPTRNLDGTPRRQVHARRAHSFLCVFAKPRRRK